MAENLVFGLPPEELGKVFRKVIDKAWYQPGFFKRLEANPREVLAGLGWNVPEGQNVRYVMDTEKLRHIVIPAPAMEWGETEVPW